MMLPPDPVYIFKGDMDSVMCLSYKVTDSTELIYAGTQTGKVHIWSLKTMREIGTFQSGEDSCLSINIPESDESTIITQNKSGRISFWKEESNQWILINSIDTNFFGFCKAFAFKDHLFTSLKESHCQIISLKTQQLVKTVKLSDGTNLGEIMMFKVLEIDKNLYILVIYEGCQLILWSFHSMEKVSNLQLPDCPMAVDFDIKTCRGLCGNPTNQIQTFSLNKSLELKMGRPVALVNEGVASIQIRPDSKLVAVGCWDGRLRLYSWKTLTLLAALDTHSSTVQDVCFFSCGKKNKSGSRYLLAAGSKDCRISLWDIYN